MCGIWWKTRWFSSKTQPVQEHIAQTLSGESGDLTLRPYCIKVDPAERGNLEEDEDAVWAEPEIWGEVEGVKIGAREAVEDKDEDSDH